MRKYWKGKDSNTKPKLWMDGYCFLCLYQCHDSRGHLSALYKFYNTQNSLKALGGKEQSLINTFIDLNNKNFREENGTILPRLLYSSTPLQKRGSGGEKHRSWRGSSRISVPPSCSPARHVGVCSPTSQAGLLSLQPNPPPPPPPSPT